MSEEVYERSQRWLANRQAGQTIEVLLDLPGYGWEEITDIDLGNDLVIVTVRKSLAAGQFEDVACHPSDLKAARVSPVPG